MLQHFLFNLFLLYIVIALLIIFKTKWVTTGSFMYRIFVILSEIQHWDCSVWNSWFLQAICDVNFLQVQIPSTLLGGAGDCSNIAQNFISSIMHSFLGRGYKYNKSLFKLWNIFVMSSSCVWLKCDQPTSWFQGQPVVLLPCLPQYVRLQNNAKPFFPKSPFCLGILL